MTPEQAYWAHAVIDELCLRASEGIPGWVVNEANQTQEVLKEIMGDFKP